MQKVYHGNIQPEDVAQALIGEFNRGNMKAQKIGSDDEIVVQIATREMPRSGGHTALTVTLRRAEDGVIVQMGKQNWLGVAASLGQSTLMLWRNPWRLIERIDDIAQDIEYLSLSEKVWNIIQETAEGVGATHELSERLKRVVCAYCLTANPVGESNCIACGAPLGLDQPTTCPKCGYVVSRNAVRCDNCGEMISSAEN